MAAAARSTGRPCSVAARPHRPWAPPSALSRDLAFEALASGPAGAGATPRWSPACTGGDRRDTELADGWSDPEPVGDRVGRRVGRRVDRRGDDVHMLANVATLRTRRRPASAERPRTGRPRSRRTGTVALVDARRQDEERQRDDRQPDEDVSVGPGRRSPTAPWNHRDQQRRRRRRPGTAPNCTYPVPHRSAGVASVSHTHWPRRRG